VILRRAALGLASAAVAAGPARAQSAKVERIDVLESGQYTGITLPKFVDTSLRVPGKVGTRFGLRIRVVGRPADAHVTLREIWRLPRPGARDPSTGRNYLEVTTDFQARMSEAFVRGYSFDQAWQIVPGEWLIEIWDGVRKMHSHRFTVFNA
jgi:hypothetical protein